MKITVTATSTSLENLLTVDQKKEIQDRQASFWDNFALIIQNRGWTPIYIENLGTVASTDSYALSWPSEKLQPIDGLGKLFLYAEAPTDVHLLADMSDKTRY